MSPENKQRVVGVIVLIAFIALLIPFLFTSGVKKRHKAVDEAAIPTQNFIPGAAVENSQIPNDMQPATIPQEPIKDVANAAVENSQVPNDVQPATIPQEPIKDVANAAALPEDLQQQSMPTVQSTISPEAQSEKQDMFPEGEQVLPPLPPEVGLAKQEVLPKPEVFPSLPVNAQVASSIAGNTSAKPEIDFNAQAVSGKAEKTVVKPVVSAKQAKIERAVKAKKIAVKSKGIPIISKVKTIQKGAPMFWSVQVGSFSDQSRMQKMVANLQEKGFRVYLQKIDTSNGLMVRVLVGRETTKEKAVKIASQLKKTLKKLKIDGRVVGNKK